MTTDPHTGQPYRTYEPRPMYRYADPITGRIVSTTSAAPTVHLGLSETCAACRSEFGGPVEPEHSILRDEALTVA